MKKFEKISIESLDIKASKLEKLKNIFPEIFINNALDLEKFKNILLESKIEIERFGLSWKGKNDSQKIFYDQTTGTLTPLKKESENFENSENIIIEGDNLEVLKILQKSYFGKVKMIYIDPPYNTGNEFIYKDDYRESLNKYLERTNQIDGSGFKLTTNTDVGGRFNSTWLSMMYPRLFLAKELLKEDGVIFISIDITEQAYLKIICDEIFGRENSLGEIIWETATDNNPTQISIRHEYVLAYAKNKNLQESWKVKSDKIQIVDNKYKELKVAHRNDLKIIRDELKKWFSSNKKSNEIDLSGIEHYDYVDEKGIYSLGNSSNTKPGDYTYDIKHPRTKKNCNKPGNGWRWPEKTFQENDKNGEVHWGDDETTMPRIKKRLETATETLTSYFYEDNRKTTNKLDQLFGKRVFDNPKSINLLKKLIKFTTKDDDLILDFFAGSGSTAQAIYEQNIYDKNKRRYILIQLPEKVNKSDTEYKTIIEITRARIKKIISTIKNDQFFINNNNILGFKSFKLSSSNFKNWDGNIEKVDKLVNELKLFKENIIKKANVDDLLFEIILKAGFPLNSKIENIKIDKKEVFLINNSIIICLVDKLNIELIEALIKLNSTEIICLDSSFDNNDELKVNVMEILKVFNNKNQKKITLKVI